MVTTENKRRHKFYVALAQWGMTQTDFAMLIGVHKSTLSNVLNGYGVSARVDGEIDSLIVRTPVVIMEEQYEAA